MVADAFDILEILLNNLTFGDACLLGLIHSY